MVSRADLADTAEPVLLIALGDITIPQDRLRSLKPADATAFAVAMDADGQYEPIAVTQLPGRTDFLLVDGLHRLEGARINGWASIEARIVKPDAAGRLRREVLSEIVRAKSDCFDKAAQVKALADHARSSGLTPPIAPRGIAETDMMSVALKWEEQTAAAFDITPRTVFRHLKIAETFDASWIARLRKLDRASEQVPLLFLATQRPKVIEKAIGYLEKGANPTGIATATIAEAVARAIGSAVPDRDQKLWNAIDGSFGKLSEQAKRDKAFELVRLYPAIFASAVRQAEAGHA